MMQEKKTEMSAFKEFLELLKKHKDENYIDEHVYLVLDNHKAHYAKKIRGAYTGFKTLFLPAYSSHLSGVETLWSIYKGHFQKHMQRINYELTQTGFEAEADFMCSQMDLKYDGRKVFMSAREELLKAMEDEE